MGRAYYELFAAWLRRALGGSSGLAHAAATAQHAHEDESAETVLASPAPASSTGIALAAPILIDFDLDGTSFVTMSAANVSFDQDGDGDKERTAWFETGDAMLVIDRNDNGKIDDIKEISFVQDLAGAKTDLEGLAAYDTNHDGKITATDTNFAKLKLWFDRDGDGVTDAGELVGLTQMKVVEIGLTATQDATTGRQADGSMLYGKAQFKFEDGRTGGVYDAGLAYIADTVTHATGIAGSPSVAGSGPGALRLGHELKAKKYFVKSLDGRLAVNLRKANGDVDSRAGGLGPLTFLDFADKSYGYLGTIVLDLDGDGLETKRFGKTDVGFDMDGDGTADDTGWTTSRDGFLVVDRNNNGKIDNGTELSFRLDAPNARSAMEGLAAFDSNKDGLISVLDSRFGELKVWVDGNRNGVTDTGELRTLTEAGIVSLSVRSTATDDAQKLGHNVVLSTSVINRADGSTASMADVAVAFSASGQAAPAATGLFAQVAAGRAPTQPPGGGNFTLEDILDDDFFARFDGSSDPAAVDGQLPALPPLPAGMARLVALITQDMAAFGNGAAIDDLLRPNAAAPQLLDYYA